MIFPNPFRTAPSLLGTSNLVFVLDAWYIFQLCKTSIPACPSGLPAKLPFVSRLLAALNITLCEGSLMSQASSRPLVVNDWASLGHLFVSALSFRLWLGWG